ncbi:hypothetical protein CN918_28880 [Priestia megaterium]|nr:hypothetical protein CN918_28880 [Priestia megaterium]
MHTFHEQVKEAVGEYLSSISLCISSWDVYTGQGSSNVKFIEYDLEHNPDKRANEERYGRKGRIKNVIFKPTVKIQEKTTFGEILLLIEKEKLTEANRDLGLREQT